LKFYQHKDKLLQINSVFAYLYIILKNQILNYHRSNLIKNKYEQFYTNTNENIIDTSLNGLLELKDLEKQIEISINQLPEKCRQVFLLKRKENFSNKQIAEALNISENTVEQHMRKALSRLRISLGDYFLLIFVIQELKYDLLNRFMY
jgi:RNA polymerase sigma-70 factor (ECF subfamily)